ncbi:hypothetical protein DMJ13_26890 [halophilic archaeon]|nr:hypothetical protein DMJ13_26890 [halophilic archaeon]
MTAQSETQSGVLPSAISDELVETYCLHRTMQPDDERGEQYIRETDGVLVRSQFWRHPYPAKDPLFVSAAHYVTAVENVIDDP